MKINAYHVPGVPGGFCLNQPDRGVWEGCEINVPDHLIYGENAFGELILILDGEKYPLGDVLMSWGGKPCLRWYDGAEHRIMLE